MLRITQVMEDTHINFPIYPSLKPFGVLENWFRFSTGAVALYFTALESIGLSIQLLRSALFSELKRLEREVD